MENLEKLLQKDLMAAIKTRDTSASMAIRSIKAAILVEESNGQHHELSDNDILKLIQRLVKQRKESYEIYMQSGRTELAEKELCEQKVLERYLPTQMSEDELHNLIDKIIADTSASSMRDMGKVMGALKKDYDGQYDNKTASEYIKSKLS